MPSPIVSYGLPRSILLGRTAIPEERSVIIQLRKNYEMLLWLQSKRGPDGNLAAILSLASKKRDGGRVKSEE